MIQAALTTDKGPIGIIGINRKNLQNMTAGRPLDIDIKKITPPGTRMNRVVIHYGNTYEDVVKDMIEAGFSVPDELLKEAKTMDERLSRDGVNRDRPA